MRTIAVFCRVLFCSAMAAMMAGCSSGLASAPVVPVIPVVPAGPTAATSVYVLQDPTSGSTGSGSILQFSANGTGSVLPTSTITGPPNTLFTGLDTDGTGNIYVGTTGAGIAGDVREYASGSSGAATPVRTLPGGSTTKIDSVNGLAVSPGGEIFLSQDSGSIVAFSATATGSVAPARYILGASQTGGGLSTIVVANAVAVDNADNLYVVNEGGPGLQPIVVFGPTATGNAPPLRTIGGPLTLTSTSIVGGVATDSAGNLYVTATSVSGPAANPVFAGSILVFAAGASGNVAPVRVITGAATQLGPVLGIRVDAIGSVYVVTATTAAMTPTVLKFLATATGNVAPTSSFTSSAWTNPNSVASIAVH